MPIDAASGVASPSSNFVVVDLPAPFAQGSPVINRSAILQAEGAKQAAVLAAQGAQQAAVLAAEGNRQAKQLEAEGEARAIEQVFAAIHAGRPNAELLAYQYLQQLPKIAEGESSKMWIIPSEAMEAIKHIGEGFASKKADPAPSDLERR